MEAAKVILLWLSVLYHLMLIKHIPFIIAIKIYSIKIGAGSFLGIESNVKNSQEGRKAFFNWISADDNIATARGGGGGLALWKRDE